MAAVSLDKINKTALAERKTHKKISMIMNIMLAVATVLTWMVDNDGLRALGIFLFCVGIGIGVIASVSVFREMTNSQLCDVKLSLPMSNKERYLSRLLTLGYIHIFPMLIYGFFAAGGIYITENYMSDSMSGMGGVNFTEVAAMYLMMASFTFFTDVITVLCTTCCGALAESVYFSIIALGCLSVTPGVMYYRIAESFAGLGEIPKFIRYWTFSVFMAAADGVGAEEALIPSVISILISFAVFWAVYFIYRRRDASTVGDPIAVRTFFEVIMALGVFMIYSVFICTNEMKIGVILTAIIYVIINIIVIRAKINIKQILKWLLKLAATSAAFMVIVVAGFLTDGFGAYNYLPVGDLGKDRVYINSDCDYDDDTETYHHSDSYNADGEYGELTNEQIRDAVKTVRSYGVTDKTSERFFALVGGYAPYKDGTSDDDMAYTQIAIYKRVKDPYYEDYNTVVLHQSIDIRMSDVEALYNELESKGLHVDVNRDSWLNDNAVYDEYGNILYYDNGEEVY